MSKQAVQEVVSEALTEYEGLPEGWVLSTIETVFELNPRKGPKDELPESAPVTFVPMPAVDAESRTITAPQEKPFSSVRKGYTSFRENDVLFAKITPCMENGKAAIARDLTNGIGFGSTEFHVLRPTGAVIPEYIYHYIGQESFLREAESEMTGSVGQKRVPTSFLEDAPLPLPPLVEQKRIVSQIDSLLGRVNAAHERLAKAPAILKRFRQSVLAAACSGQLTTDWREIRKIGDWYFKPLGEFAINIQTGPFGSALHRHEYVANQIPLVNPMHIQNGVIIPASDYCVTNEKAKELSRYRLQEGDIVLARRGEMGRAAVVQTEQTGFLCGTGSLFLRISDIKTIYPEFACLYLRNPRVVEYLENSSVGSTMTNLNQRIIKSINFPNVDYCEQQEIVCRVDALFALAARIEQRYRNAAERIDKITQSILSKAFCGELVETEAELARREGRDYESAVQLLERIAAYRENTTAKTGRRKGSGF